MKKESTFVKLLHDNQGIIHKICGAYVSGPSYDDLFQEVVINLWKGYDNFKGDSKPSTWMYKVALYTALNFVRYEKKRTHDSLDKIKIPTVYQDNSETTEMIHLAMSHLNPEEKALLILHLEDKSYEDISDIIGITPSNVGARLSRIRKRLKTIINKL